jgi:hyperosmotically inducible protein
MKHNIWILALAFALAASLAACKKEEEGTMEKMGKAVDSAVHDTKDAVEEATHDAGRAVEDAAEEVEEAVEDAKD